MTEPTGKGIAMPEAGLDQEFDALVCKVSGKLESGRSVDWDALAAEHPQHIDRLRKLLPTLEAMADLGHSIVDDNHAVEPSKRDRGTAQGVLGDYRILREIGRGGMGVVYEAEQLSLRRPVALKVLPFAAVLDQRQIRRFQNEALAAAQLKHPNIVSVFGVGCERSVHFYAMEYVEGQTLAEVISDLRRLEERPGGRGKEAEVRGQKSEVRGRTRRLVRGMARLRRRRVRRNSNPRSSFPKGRPKNLSRKPKGGLCKSRPARLPGFRPKGPRNRRRTSAASRTLASKSPKPWTTPSELPCSR